MLQCLLNTQTHRPSKSFPKPATTSPVSAPRPFLQHFEAWNFLSKEFHSDGHEEAAAVCVAAAGVYHQKHQQEDHHDDGNHGAFGHGTRFEER